MKTNLQKAIKLLIKNFRDKVAKLKEDKTNVFKISWDSYAEEESFLYTHSNKTEKEFKDDVKNLMLKYWSDYLKQEDSWAGLDGLIYFINNKVKELGYESVIPVVCSYYAGYIIDDLVEDSEIGNIVCKEFLEQCIIHNKIIENNF
jgi:hypothetical protein